jgi:hypothetical protein
MESFSDRYKQLVSEYYRPLTIEDGVTELSVVTCEERLGLTLPTVLRDFYMIAGKMSGVTDAYNHLVPIEDLSVYDNETVVFYAENQHVVLWGIDVSACAVPDPPVLQAVNAETLVWKREFNVLSEFLYSMFYWQITEGTALPYGGVARLDEKQMSIIEDKWPRDTFVTQKHEGGPLVFCKTGQVLCVSKGEYPYRLQAACRSREDMLSLQETLKLKWRLHRPKII